MTPANLRQYKGLLLDANLLLLYCVGRHDPFLITRFTQRLSRYTVDDYHLLTRFTALFATLTTTPNVVTEVVNLIDKRSGQYAGVLNQMTTDVAAMHEQYVPTSMVFTEESRYVTTFGLTDVVLYRLAQQSYCVLTDDGALWSFLQGKGCATFNFEELRSAFLQRGPSGRNLRQ